MLTPEGGAVRAILVDQLGHIDGLEATQALARLAVFDLSPGVRRTAVQLLESRKADDYRPVLLAGLRYPWRDAAEHAGEALVALGATDVIPALEKMMDELDPDEPVVDPNQGVKVVREMVRINHLCNCLLCHAPDPQRIGLLPARLPVLGEPLPPSREYYDSERPGIFARADFVYLRQDFSVSLPVGEREPWPEIQRYDFVVRTRRATDADLWRPRDPAFRNALRHALVNLKRQQDSATLGP
jgi:hypothetical protein